MGFEMTGFAISGAQTRAQTLLSLEYGMIAPTGSLLTSGTAINAFGITSVMVMGAGICLGKRPALYRDRGFRPDQRRPGFGLL